MTAVHESVPPPAPTAPHGPPNRAAKVRTAAEGWAAELAALNGRDPLLHYRDLKVGTLDLAAGDPDHRKRLLAGDPVPISRLFPHEPLRSSALRSARMIRDSVRELSDERGIEAGHLIVGIATWANPYAAHRPSAPVLLRRAAITARDPAETDFVITVLPEAHVNSALLDAMERQLGLRFTEDDLRDPDGELRYPSVIERLHEFAPAHVVDGFSIAHRAVLGRFPREPITLASDVDALAGELEQHEAIAALAGDTEAATALREAGAQARHRLGAVLPFDAAQRDVIAAIAGGRNLRIQAPPGTGRTQTIANAVAELVAQGQRVLVVGNKRASLADLATRLDGAGLGEVVLDTTTAALVQEDVRRVIETAKRLDDTPPERPTVDEGDEVPGKPHGYFEALHRRREPWGTSAYQLMAAVSSVPAPAKVATRFDEASMRRLGIGTFEAMRVKLREYVDLGGLGPRDPDAVWANATVPNAAAATRVRDALVALRTSTMPALKDAATRAAVEVGLAGPATPADALAMVDLLADVARTRDTFVPDIWDAPLDDFVAATADRRWRAAQGTRLGPIARRRLRLQVRDLLIQPDAMPDRAQLHTFLAAAHDQRATWREQARDGRPPHVGEYLPTAMTTAAAVREQLRVLATAEPGTADLAGLPFGAAARRLAELGAAERDLLALPRAKELHRDLVDAGLEPLMDELGKRAEPVADVDAAITFAWQSSLLDLWRSEDPELSKIDPAELEASLSSAGDTDPATVRARVLSGRAARFAAVTSEFEGQTAVVVESARSGHGPATLRELVGAAPDVTLAAMPCWIAAPLSVASVLPARCLFDVVIVEDAGLLPPAHAVASIARAHRVVLVGDDEQLPLPAFVTTAEPVVDDTDSGPPVRSGTEPLSVLDALAGSLPVLPLTNQYRVRDDRLLRFAADTTYQGRMALLPAGYAPPRLQHEVVDPNAADTDSSEAEVRRVVDLVLDHARTRPHESLGVVTLSRPHAARVESTLRAALVRNPDVAAFLAEDRSEPFFIKDVARVAGDVRDAMVLSLGFGRSVDGRVLYRFGELDRPGGERRLAAAITRSRERTTVVSCFGADDLSPRRLTTAGGQSLRDFLSYAADPTTPTRNSDRDPLTEVIGNRLEEAGASVVLDHGAASGPIEIAVRHPKRRDRFVLAVETDSDRFAGVPGEVDHLQRTERLVSLGWSVHRVWSAAWAADPDGEAARLVRAYESAVADADAYDWAVAAVEADVVAGMPEEDVAEDAGAEEEADDGTKSTRGKPAKRGSAKNKRGKGLARKKRGPEPKIVANRPISAHTRRELAALARWVESDGRSRSEADVMAELAKIVRPIPDDARAEDVLRYAVRLARAGSPPL